MSDEQIRPYRPPSENDPQLRARARKRLHARADFDKHLVSYALVNALLVVIWMITGMGYFWPIWPILGWGVGLAFHFASLRWDRGITEEQIAREADKIRRLEGRDGPQDTR